MDQSTESKTDVNTSSSRSPGQSTPIPHLNDKNTNLNRSSPTTHTSPSPSTSYPSYTDLANSCPNFMKNQSDSSLDKLNNGFYKINFRKLCLSQTTKQTHINNNIYISPPEFMLLLHYIMQKNSSIYFISTATRTIMQSFYLFVRTIFRKHNQLNYNDNCRSLIDLMNLVADKVSNLNLNKFKQSDAFKSRKKPNDLFKDIELSTIAGNLDLGDISFTSDGDIAHSVEEVVGGEKEAVPSIDSENGGSWSLGDSLSNEYLNDEQHDDNNTGGNDDDDIDILNGRKNGDKNITNNGKGKGKHESDNDPKLNDQQIQFMNNLHKSFNNIYGQKSVTKSIEEQNYDNFVQCLNYEVDNYDNDSINNQHLLNIRQSIIAEIELFGWDIESFITLFESQLFALFDTQHISNFMMFYNGIKIVTMQALIKQKVINSNGLIINLRKYKPCLTNRQIPEQIIKSNSPTLKRKNSNNNNNNNDNNNNSGTNRSYAAFKRIKR
eukprot:175855_1